jgi:hypothetical protein
MWRELISALLQVEGPFAVAVHAPDDMPGFWDLARDHYGTRVEIHPHAGATEVLAAVKSGAATVRILPMPSGAEASPGGRFSWIATPVFLMSWEGCPSAIAATSAAARARPW